MAAELSATDKNANVTISGAGRVATGSGTGGIFYSGQGDVTTTTIPNGERRFWEFELTTLDSGVGISVPGQTFTDNEYLGNAGGNSIGWYTDGNIHFNGSIVATGPTYAPGDRVAIACHAGTKIWLSVNGVFDGDPVAGTGGLGITGFTGDIYPAYTTLSGRVLTANLDAATFVDAPPTGFTGFEVGGGGANIDVVPGVVEVVGASPLVAGTFEAVNVVAGIVEVVGAVLEVEAGGGATFTLTANSGSYVITGTTATLRISAYRLSAASGTFTIVGSAASLFSGDADEDFALDGSISIGPLLTGTPYVGAYLTGMVCVG